MKRFYTFLAVVLFAAGLRAQSPYYWWNYKTAVPFLLIAPDARAAAMGDGGAATANDANAIHWNLANLSFAKKKASFAVSYTPWMRALIPDINHAYVAFSLKCDSVSALAASMRYFSMGNITTTGISGTPTQYRPNEFAFDIGYTRKLSKQFAAGITARFIQSNPSGLNGIVVRNGGGRACAGDVSFAWKGNTIGKDDRTLQPSVGLAITNVGTKMWYQDRDSAEFLPMNARMGAAIQLHNEARHQLTVQAEANRLLVPVSTIAPPGKEVNLLVLSAGAEYVYNHTFKVRGGYVHDPSGYGTVQYFTTGIGIEYHIFQLDFSYLFPFNGSRSPLQNTLRFSLLFSFDAMHVTPYGH